MVVQTILSEQVTCAQDKIWLAKLCKIIVINVQCNVSYCPRVDVSSFQLSVKSLLVSEWMLGQQELLGARWFAPPYDTSMR